MECSTEVWGEAVGKVMSAGFEDGKTFQKLRDATIKKKYNTEEVKLRVTGHILYREAEMTFSRKAFLKIFDNQEFTQLVYR